LKAIIIGSAVVISVVAAILIFAMNPATQNPGLENYTGKLVSGSSYMPFGGEPIAEMHFEDGRTFTAPEQLAAQANMTIGKTYQITYNSTAPSVALEIQEVQP